MPAERYLFLIKGTLVLAQPLAAPETGELLTSLLQQGFAVGPLQVWASNTEQALAWGTTGGGLRATGLNFDVRKIGRAHV